MAALVKAIYKNRGLDATWSALSAVATWPGGKEADRERGRPREGV